MQHHIPGSLLSVSLLALGLACAGNACAQEQQRWSRWSVSGFGTLGLVHSSERQADYTSSVLKLKGAGASRPWSADVDSRLGLQLDLRASRQWSAVLQVVSELGLDNSYRPKVEWANIKYQATPDLALRAGRIALPMFLTADYRRVGYAYPWVGPPVLAYGALRFTNSDGVDATWRWSAGAVRNASQVFYGHSETRLIPPLRAVARGIVGVSNTSDWGALSVRVNLIQADATSDIAAELFDTYDAFGPAGQALSRRYEIDHKLFSVANVGVSYDPGRWFVMAEAGRTHTDSLLGATRSAYVSAGWRQGAFTPYATWSRVRAVGGTFDAGLPLSGLTPALAVRVAQMNAGLNMLLATIPQQSSVSAGVRWDLRTNTALKLQYDRVTPHEGSRGNLINTTPAFRSGRTAHVASVAFDFVY